MEKLMQYDEPEIILYKEAFLQSNIAIFVLKITKLVEIYKSIQEIIINDFDGYISEELSMRRNIHSLVIIHSMNSRAAELIGGEIDFINIERLYKNNNIIKKIFDSILNLLVDSKKAIECSVDDGDSVKNYFINCNLIKKGIDSFVISSVCDVTKQYFIGTNVTSKNLLGYVEKYYLLIKSINDALILVKVNTGLIIEYNKAACDLLNINDFSAGYNHTSFFKGKNKKKYISHYKNSLNNKNIDELYVQLSVGKNEIDVKISISFSYIEGEKIAQIIFSDLRNKLQLEERKRLLATAVDQVGESVVITNCSGDIEYVNSAYEEISGYSLSEVIGKKPNIFQDGRLSSYHYALMWEEISQGRVWRGNFTNKKKNGESYCEDVTISPVKDQSGEIVNFIAVKRDITQQLVLESQIRQSQKMQAIGMLAGGIAHDFNNILTAILGYAELCQMQCDKKTIISSNIDEIVKASLRAGKLVDQILQFSRHKNKEIVSFSINAILKEVYKLIRASIPPDIQIDLEIFNEIFVKGDQTQIHQVLMNLCTNAYQSIEKKDGKITIRMFSEMINPATAVSIGRLQAGKYVCIQIEDTGNGIPEEYVQRIFEPYFSTRKLQGGTGLGLSVVHGIVNEHRGAITVKSRLGSGSCFNVYLPETQIGNDGYEQTPHKKSPINQRAD